MDYVESSILHRGPLKFSQNIVEKDPDKARQRFFGAVASRNSRFLLRDLQQLPAREQTGGEFLVVRLDLGLVDDAVPVVVKHGHDVGPALREAFSETIGVCRLYFASERIT